jgi:uncharacterized OB-fold protein
MSVSRPLPNPDALTRPYWEGAKKRELVLPRCDSCDRWHFYPRSVCPHCGSNAIAWQRTSGRGVIYSATHVHRAPSSAFEQDVPYVVAIVALEEGPHLMSTIIDCNPSEAAIGAPVIVDFIDEDDMALPAFRLAQVM